MMTARVTAAAHEERVTETTIENIFYSLQNELNNLDETQKREVRKLIELNIRSKTEDEILEMSRNLISGWN